MFGSFMNHQLSLVLREPALSQSDPVAPLINSLHELCAQGKYCSPHKTVRTGL